MIHNENIGGIAVLSIEHGKANAMDLEVVQELAAAIEAERTSTSRAIVLTAKGGIFCAGVDLVRILDEGAAYAEAFLPALDRCFSALFFHPKPVVVALNGHAIAGGCVLALAADHRVLARTKATLGAPELTVGVPFPPVALEILRWTLPPPTFQRAAFGGRLFDVEQSLAAGLVDEVVEPAELLEVARRRAETLAAIPVASFRVNKAMARQGVRDHLERHAQAAMAAVVEAWSSAEVRAAIKAYVARVLKRS